MFGMVRYNNIEYRYTYSKSLETDDGYDWDVFEVGEEDKKITILSGHSDIVKGDGYILSKLISFFDGGTQS